jgi:hypothetical protein
MRSGQDRTGSNPQFDLKQLQPAGTCDQVQPQAVQVYLCGYCKLGSAGGIMAVGLRKKPTDLQEKAVARDT